VLVGSSFSVWVSFMSLRWLVVWFDVSLCCGCGWWVWVVGLSGLCAGRGSLVLVLVLCV